MTLSIKPLVAATCAVLTAASSIAAPALAQTYGASQTVTAGSGPRLINLPRGTSFAVDLPADARDVIVSNPAVAEANVHSPRRITVIGIAPGETDAVFLDAAGRSILTLRVRVDAGVSALQDTLSRVAPGSQVRAEAVNDSIVLTGVVTSAAEAERIASVARAFVSAPEKVLNLTTIAASDQVTLRVRIVEVQRNAIKQLGFSSDVVFNSGLQSIGFSRTNTYGVNGAALGGSGACYNENRGRETNFSETSDITGANSQNTVTGSSITDFGTVLTTSDGRSVFFDNASPGTILVVNPGGTSVTLSGTEAATYLRGTLTGANGVGNVGGLADALEAAGSTPGSVTAATLNALVRQVTGAVSGNSLSTAIQNVAQSAYQTVRGTNASACLQAFERVGLVRTLAEPNLTSVNGEAASFLAGGEFPVPTGRDRDGNVTIEFKPYGVSLSFRPIVLSEGRISLQLNAEVSELTQTGGITLGAGTNNPLNIAGLNVRRVTNTVEMPSGGSMMIAGLLQESTRQTVDSYPGLGGLPVLGGLFRSRDYLSGETELVVIVEPFIVNPTSRDQMQTPADGLRIASDLQTVFLGQLNQAYGTPAPGPSAPAWQGPIGYVIE
jgi:pilus assembly protein CpaC